MIRRDAKAHQHFPGGVDVLTRFPTKIYDSYPKSYPRRRSASDIPDNLTLSPPLRNLGMNIQIGGIPRSSHRYHFATLSGQLPEPARNVHHIGEHFYVYVTINSAAHQATQSRI
jgi:hypothetical protein